MAWLVIYTKPKSEYKVSESLKDIGIRAYCPMVTRIKQYSDRKKKVQAPLFSSYVFVNISERERDRVFEISGVVRYVFWLGRPAVVRETEIKVLKNNLNGIVIDDVSLTSLQKGKTMQIPSGSFKGISGTILNVEKHTVRLVIESLGVLVTLTRAA